LSDLTTALPRLNVSGFGQTAIKADKLLVQGKPLGSAVGRVQKCPVYVTARLILSVQTSWPNTVLKVTEILHAGPPEALRIAITANEREAATRELYVGIW
jgi:hypothetical protein